MGSILIVDDEPDMRALLAGILELAGHDIAMATDGAEGLEYIGEHHVDAVVLDLGMPGVDGFEVLEHLQDQDHAPPVVVVTANAVYAAGARARQLGAAAVLTKPFDPARVVEAVEAAASEQTLRDSRTTPAPSVLLIDDVTKVAQHLVQRLQAAGATSVDWAPSAATARVLASEVRFDIVIASQALGAGAPSGIDVLSDLRRLLPTATMACIASIDTQVPGWCARVDAAGEGLEHLVRDWQSP